MAPLDSPDSATMSAIEVPGEAVAGEPGAGGVHDLLAAGVEVRLA